jgi:hypothetical protein
MPEAEGHQAFEPGQRCSSSEEVTVNRLLVVRIRIYFTTRIKLILLAGHRTTASVDNAGLGK